jgi:hypothetical protein
MILKLWVYRWDLYCIIITDVLLLHIIVILCAYERQLAARHATLRGGPAIKKRVKKDG